MHQRDIIPGWLYAYLCIISLCLWFDNDFRKKCSAAQNRHQWKILWLLRIIEAVVTLSKQRRQRTSLLRKTMRNLCVESITSFQLFSLTTSIDSRNRNCNQWYRLYMIFFSQKDENISLSSIILWDDRQLLLANGCYIRTCRCISLFK